MHCYMIETLPFGENCYIFYDDISKECAVIDPGGSYNKIVNFINKKQLIMKAVILTHSHADHIGALEEIINFYKDIEIIASRREKKLLNNPNYNLTEKFNLEHNAFEATKYVEDGDTYTIGDTVLEFMVTPGHTAGSMCVLSKKDNLIFVGDTLFAGSIGRTDLPTGSYEDMEKSLERLAKLDKNLIVLSGHGDSTTIGKELMYNPFMKNIG